MTCIVGIEYNGKVLIGGDVQGTSPNHKIVHTQPKVFFKKDIIIGYTTSYRFGQILENNLLDPVAPEDDEEVYRWLVTVLVPNIRETLDKNKYPEGGTCLIGVRGQLWSLQSDYSVLRSVLGYESIGSGCEYALGSIYTSLNNRKTRPSRYSNFAEIVSTAIRTAGQFSPSVGTDSVIIST